MLLCAALPTPDSDARHEPPPREARYANYMAAGHNAFEFFLEFGQVIDEGEPHVHTRIVTAPAAAKGFCRTLTQSIRQYEASYGPADDLPPEPGAEHGGSAR